MHAQKLVITMGGFSSISTCNQLTHNWLLIVINYNLKVVYITRASAWKKMK